MSGPSDGFFRDIVKAVGGKLADGLPDLEKRQAAAMLLGKPATLAEIAVAIGLMDATKLHELGALERGKPAAARTVSSKKVPVAAPPPPPTPAPPPAPPPRKRLRDRAKRMSSAALQTLSSLKPGKRRGRPDLPASGGAPPGPANPAAPALVAAGVVVALLLVAGAAIVATHSSTSPPDGPVPVVAPPAPPPPAPESTPSSDDDRRTRLGMIAAAAIKRAKEGDFDGAEEKVDAMRRMAHADDRQIVEDAERSVKLAKAAAGLHSKQQ